MDCMWVISCFLHFTVMEFEVGYLQSVSYLPGFSLLHGGTQPCNSLGPDVSIVCALDLQSFLGYHLTDISVYKKYDSENVSAVPFLHGIAGIYTSNLDVARQALASGPKSSFVKPHLSVQELV
jgi:hypothetical protein